MIVPRWKWGRARGESGGKDGKVWTVEVGVDGGGAGEVLAGGCGDDGIGGWEGIELFDGEEILAEPVDCNSKASSGDCFNDIAFRR